MSAVIWLGSKASATRNSRSAPCQSRSYQLLMKPEGAVSLGERFVQVQGALQMSARVGEGIDGLHLTNANRSHLGVAVGKAGTCGRKRGVEGERLVEVVHAEANRLGVHLVPEEAAFEVCVVGGR